METAQSVFQLPKIDKENFSKFRPEGLRQESLTNSRDEVHTNSPDEVHTNSPDEGPQVETSRSFLCLF